MENCAKNGETAPCEGNTNSSHEIAEDYEKGNEMKHWFFTFNNYTDEEMNDCAKKFNEICEKFVFQEEIGEVCKTKHLQGTITLKRKMRWSEFKLSKKIKWMKPIKLKACYDYCCKEKTRNGKIFCLNFQIPKTFRIRKSIDKLWDWQEKLTNYLLNNEPDDRTINWYYSTEGKLGKTTIIRHFLKIEPECTTFILDGNIDNLRNIIFNFMYDEKTQEQIRDLKYLFINIPRNNGNKMSYTLLEQLKDGLLQNNKYHTGCKEIPELHITVFSNEPPEIEKLSDDRWNINEVYKDNNNILTKKIKYEDLKVEP